MNTIRLSNQDPVPIQLSETEDQQSWVKNIYIGDCTIVEGTNGVRYVVWKIKIETANGANIVLYKRYSDFVKFRELLVRYYPKNKDEIAELPPKRFLKNFSTSFLNSRRAGLEYFLSSILLHPKFSESGIVKDFVKS